MKKFLAAICLGGCLLSACTEDNSTLPHLDISDIEIAAFQEGGYSIISYSGNKLELVADVISGYDESELTYTWYIIDKAKEESMTWTGSGTYEQEKIGEGKTLSYEVNLPPGEYTIVCEVKASNGYTVTKETTLVTSTNFASGHYILKETADGNTEVDVYNETDEKLIENVLTAALGQSMTGAPLKMSMCFGHCFINQATNEMAASNLMTVVTKSGEFKSFNTTDLSVVLERENLLYNEMEADEYPYAIQSGMWTNYLFTNKGVRSQYSSMMGLASGKYGVAAGEGASEFIVYSSGSMGVLYWDENTHSIVTCDYNGGYSQLNDMATPTSGLTDYECIASGISNLMSMAYFLLENKSTGERVLYLVESSFMGTYVYEARTLPTDSHLAQSTLFSTSVSSSTYIYGLHDNVVYAYDMNTGNEEALNFAGLPADETIAYVSNQYLSRTKDHLVVGTQKGNDYTLYYYSVLGGKPDGNPVRVVNGQGKVKSMKYTDAGINTFMTVPPYMD